MKMDKEERKTIIDNLLNRENKFKRFNSEWTTEEKPIPTNITILDNILNGGISKGITLLGGLSGYGKSTLALNMACNLANKDKTNKKVVYFSLEMSENDLIYKCLSNILYNEFNKTEMTYQDVREFYLNGENKEKEEVINKAKAYYGKYIHDNFIIIDNKTISPYIEDINDIIKDFIELKDIKPIIIIDYLQYCRTSNNYITSDKQIYDNTSRYLLDLTNKYNLSAIVLSSLNRESYKQEKSMQAFKGSGDLEYSAVNCIILDKPTKTNMEDKQYKMKEERQVQITSLKARYGALKEDIIIYNAKYNSFEWKKVKEDPTAAADTKQKKGYKQRQFAAVKEPEKIYI